MRTIEDIAAIAYDGFCRSLCNSGITDKIDHYIESFHNHIDTDIRKAWIAAVAAAVNAWDNGSEIRNNT